MSHGRAVILSRIQREKFVRNLFTMVAFVGDAPRKMQCKYIKRGRLDLHLSDVIFVHQFRSPDVRPEFRTFWTASRDAESGAQSRAQYIRIPREDAVNRRDLRNRSRSSDWGIL